MGERRAHLEASQRRWPDVHALIGNYLQLLRRLSRQRQKSGEPRAVCGIIRPAQRQAESTVGVDHDDQLRLAARASAPAGLDGGRFCSDGGPTFFYTKDTAELRDQAAWEMIQRGWNDSFGMRGSDEVGCAGSMAEPYVPPMSLAAHICLTAGLQSTRPLIVIGQSGRNDDLQPQASSCGDATAGVRGALLRRRSTG